MPNASIVWSSFNGGELSPLLDGRVDMPQYMKGAEIMVNMIPTVQGPGVRRGGARYINQTGISTQGSLLISFSRSQTESFILEFIDHKIRFYFNGALVVVNAPPFPAYTVTTPYAQADLFNADGTPKLTAIESADVIYLAHPNYQPQVLSFAGSNNWSLFPLDNTDGPWMDGNANKQNKVYITGGNLIGSTVTINATSAGTFVAGHVGSLFRLHQQDLTSIKPWAPGERTPQLAVGVFRRAGFLTFMCTNASPGIPPSGGTVLLFVQTGGTPPTQTEGQCWDGDQSTIIDPIGSNTYYSTGVQWAYQDCGYGVIQITGFISDTQVTGVVKRQLPGSLVNISGASYKWEMGAWNNANGFPSVVSIFLERLTFGALDRTWMSVVGDYANFADMDFGEVTDDNAITKRVSNGKVNDIVYFSPSQTLMVGTTGGEFLIGPQSISDPFSPGNSGVFVQSEYGGRAVSPVRVQQYTLFVTKNGRVVRESSFAFQAGPSGANVSNDVAVLSEHITEGGIVAMAWAKNPYTTVYVVLGNGNVISFTYNPEQSVKSWARQDLGGGQAISIATVPNGTGDWDDVYLTVRRTTNFNGLINTFYTIERIEQPFANLAGDSMQDAFYVDCGSTLDNSKPATLSLGNGDYTVPGTENISFIAGTGFTFTAGQEPAGDVGRYIHYDWITTKIGDDGIARPKATRGVALITQFVNAHGVLGTVLQAFPNLQGAPIPVNGWRMTVTSITNPLPMWAGQTLSLLLDGAAAPDQVCGFLGNPIPLSRPASIVQCGIKSPAVWRSMKPEGGDPTGSNMGKEKRNVRMTMRFVNTVGVSYGPSFDQLVTIDEYSPTMVDDTPLEAMTGETSRLSFNGDWDRFGRVMVAQLQPLPWTLAALAMSMGVEPDG